MGDAITITIKKPVKSVIVNHTGVITVSKVVVAAASTSKSILFCSRDIKQTRAALYVEHPFLVFHASRLWYN